MSWRKSWFNTEMALGRFSSSSFVRVADIAVGEA
jgi:hypothetical protein